MMATDIRKQLQNAAQEMASDWTREDLGTVLKRTRQQFGGLSLMEIAEVMQENLSPVEIDSLKVLL